MYIQILYASGQKNDNWKNDPYSMVVPTLALFIDLLVALLEKLPSTQYPVPTRLLNFQLAGKSDSRPPTKKNRNMTTKILEDFRWRLSAPIWIFWLWASFNSHNKTTELCDIPLIYSPCPITMGTWWNNSQTWRAAMSNERDFSSNHQHGN